MDALVSDEGDEYRENITRLMSHALEQPRRATPTVPPGFTAPVVPRSFPVDQPSRPASRNALPVAPAVPVLPAIPAQVATATSKRVEQNSATAKADPVTTPAVVNPAAATVPTTPIKTIQKTSPSNAKGQPTSIPKRNVEEASTAAQRDGRSVPASPVKATPKGKIASKKPSSVTEVTLQKDVKSPAADTLPSSKRQPPGKLNLSLTAKTAENDATSASGLYKQEISSKTVRAVSATAPNSLPVSPAATSSGSPLKKPIGAKTLRVVATPKTESPPQLPPLPNLPQVPTVEKLRSRQASIASVNQPGTPASELISDTASFTSTSISRANSPPPIGSKVGSAPVRKKTKSQAKKDRQERARQAEEERAIEEATPEPEIVQAPIVGRKKKTKKPTSNNKQPAAVTKSQPESTKLSAKEEEELEELYQANLAAKRAAAAMAAAPSPQVESMPEQEIPKERREPTAQSILADLQRTGELVASALEFFKPLSSSLAHSSKIAPMSGGPVAPPDLKIHFTEADLQALTKKQPVRLSGHDGTSDSRTLITPQGKFFWGLTQELEEKALELEKHIDELKGAARFHPKKLTAQNPGSQSLPALATALKEAGAKLSRSTNHDMPKMDSPAYQGGTSQRLSLPPVQPTDDLSGTQQPQTPADAGVYLNQFVLPNTDNPPPNAPRPEMAAVGGLPGAGLANISVNANKLAKAAKAVAEGGAVGPELEGIGAITADLLGGVFVQNLEALVGADLGFSNASLDAGEAYDLHGLVSAFEAGFAPGGGLDPFKGKKRGGNGRSVLSVEEAEQVMLAAKKDHEALEKKLSALMKRNRKMVGKT